MAKKRSIRCRWDILNKRRKYYIAVSGGVDSLTLCEILRKSRFDLTIIHVNHKMISYDDDVEGIVTKYADHSGLPIKVFRAPKTPAEECLRGTENYARNIRLAVWRQIDGDIILGHHFNDCLEWALISFLKGSTIRGKDDLIPISTQFDSARVIRPNLLSEKEEILESAKRLNLQEFVLEDPLNQKSLRGWIRDKVAPQMEGHDGGLRRGLMGRIRIAYEDFKKSMVKDENV